MQAYRFLMDAGANALVAGRSECRRFRARMPAMIAHSLSAKKAWFEDCAAPVSLPGGSPEPDRMNGIGVRRVHADARMGERH